MKPIYSYHLRILETAAKYDIKKNTYKDTQLNRFKCILPPISDHIELHASL